MQFGMSFGDTPGCCGVLQCFNFSDEYEDDDWGDEPDIVGEGDTTTLAYADLFAKLMKYNPKTQHNGRVFQMWFQKTADYLGNYGDDFEAEPLRLLIESIPNVSNLGEYVNYKSGNKIQGYQWEQAI